MRLSAPGVIILEDIEEIASASARLFVSLCAKEIKAKGFFTVVLSGGATPRALFKRLSSDECKRQVDWERVHLFWGDERMAPPSDDESNFGMAARELIAKVPVPLSNVHRVRTELLPDEAASDYEDDVKEFFKARGIAGLPPFDLVFLGLGEDGHTLSLFPGTSAAKGDETKRLVAANYVSRLGKWRVTMMPALVNQAHMCVFLVSGRSKGPALKDVLEGSSATLPAALIRPSNGLLFWLVDKGAAEGLGL